MPKKFPFTKNKNAQKISKTERSIRYAFQKIWSQEEKKKKNFIC